MRMPIKNWNDKFFYNIMDSTCFRGQYDDFLEKSGLANKTPFLGPFIRIIIPMQWQRPLNKLRFQQVLGCIVKTFLRIRGRKRKTYLFLGVNVRVSAMSGVWWGREVDFLISSSLKMSFTRKLSVQGQTRAAAVKEETSPGSQVELMWAWVGGKECRLLQTKCAFCGSPAHWLALHESLMNIRPSPHFRTAAPLLKVPCTGHLVFELACLYLAASSWLDAC